MLKNIQEKYNYLRKLSFQTILLKSFIQSIKKSVIFI